MAARRPSQSPTGLSVNLDFSHLLSRLVVSMEDMNGFNEDNIESISVYANTVATVDKEGFAITSVSTPQDIKLSGEKSEVGVCILPPQTIDVTSGTTNYLVKVKLMGSYNGQPIPAEKQTLYYRNTLPLKLEPGYTYLLRLQSSVALITGYVDETLGNFTAIAGWPEPEVTGTGTGANWQLNETDYAKALNGELLKYIQGSASIDGSTDVPKNFDMDTNQIYE